MRRLALLATLLFPLALTAAPSIVLISGRVYTGDPAKPFVDAVAIEGNKITAVGTNDAIRALVGPATQVINVRGQLVVPGFNDAHVHPGNATPMFRVNLGDDPSFSDVHAALANVLEETPGDLWIHVTVGRRIINDSSVNAAALEKIARGRKVYMTAWTGHGAILSPAAMAALGVRDDAVDPPGGWYGRDSSGRVDGRVFEAAHYPLSRKIAEMATDEELMASVRALSDEAILNGITSIQAMPAVSEKRFAAAIRNAQVPIRIRIIRFGDAAAAGNVTNGIKHILDGTPIEKNAALRNAEYEGGGKGRENYADLTPFVREAAESKQQILFHAVGDKTIESALKAFAAFPALQRPRIEHGDGLQSDLLPLTKQTGTVVVLNPSHFQFRHFFPRGEYALARKLIESGIPIAIGSDGPMHPGLNIMFATERRDDPSQALSREQALNAYTQGSAFAEMKEKQKGKIAPGMLADLAVLNQDILRIAGYKLPATQSVLTIIDGKVVHVEMD
ncbi:MAG TPA: amidohydrolase family protein [Thermoanaerobaculia bacterium]|nr:amidohydrolase family protein [Thermoanaerobaculia bacterium]